MLTKEYILKSGYPMPVLGLGTWQVNGPDLKQAVEYALSVGYRHFDTADAYSNHSELGRALAGASVDRDKIFITTKLWYDNLDEKNVHASVERFLIELKIDYIDLLLIHWPNKNISVKETLTAMAREKENKTVRALGVSNFTVKHLTEAMKYEADIEVNQVEFHPSLNQRELKDFCDRHGIRLTAYSPLAQGYDLSLPLIKELAQKYERSEAQIIINWLIGKGLATIPRSRKPKHILENFQATNFELSNQDLNRVDEEIEEFRRIITPPWAEF